MKKAKNKRKKLPQEIVEKEEYNEIVFRLGERIIMVIEVTGSWSSYHLNYAAARYFDISEKLIMESLVNEELSEILRFDLYIYYKGKDKVRSLYNVKKDTDLMPGFIDLDINVISGVEDIQKGSPEDLLTKFLDYEHYIEDNAEMYSKSWFWDYDESGFGIIDFYNDTF